MLTVWPILEPLACLARAVGALGLFFQDWNMMRSFLLMAVSCVVSSGCSTALISSVAGPEVVGNGVLKEEGRNVAEFVELEVAGVFQCKVTQGDVTYVMVRGDENLLPLVVAEVKGSRLSVRMQDNTSVRTTLPLELVVVVPDLRVVSAQGATKVEVGGLLGLRELEFEGASQIRAVEVASGELTVRGAGAAARRSVEKLVCLTWSCRGRAGWRRASWNAEGVKVRLDGASNGEVRASGSIKGSLSGACSLTVGGSPRERMVEATGASSVRYSEGS